LERTYNNHLVQLSDHFRADQKLKHVVKALSECLLNTDSLGASTASLGSLFRCLTTLFAKEMLPNVQSEPPLVQIWTIPMCPITGYQGEEICTFT